MARPADAAAGGADRGPARMLTQAAARRAVLAATLEWSLVTGGTALVEIRRVPRASGAGDRWDLIREAVTGGARRRESSATSVAGAVRELLDLADGRNVPGPTSGWFGA